jgi:hypothetical protein
LQALLEAQSLILQRENRGPLSHALAAFPCIAATVASTPARRPAAQTPQLEHTSRKRYVIFVFGGVCLGVSHSFASFIVIPAKAGIQKKQPATHQKESQ